MKYKSSLNVYITTYNRSNYLKKAIDSVLSQTYKDFQLYILDNCSEDDTGRLVASYEDARVHYIRHEHNIGGVANIKYAFKHNMADYFVIFHDDDVMDPRMLETEVDYLDAHPDVSIVSSVSGHIDENGECVEAAKSSMEMIMEDKGISEINYKGAEFICAYLNEGANIVFPSVMYRHNFIKLKELTLEEEAGSSCDTKFMFEIEKNGGEIAILNRRLMNTRIHGQESFSDFGSMYENLFIFLKNDEYFAEILKKNESGCRKLYWNLCKIIAVHMIRESFTVSQADEIERKIWNSIGGRNIDHIKYKCIKHAYKAMPKTVNRAAERYLLRERY